MTGRLVVSVHDVAPGSAQATRRWLAELDRRRIPASLLVIPGPWRAAALAGDLEFAAMLARRADGGDDLVQHGWLHRAGSDGRGWRSAAQPALARGAGEFAALDVADAERRLLKGRAVLADLGLATDGFTAPGWLHSPGTFAALKSCGFHFTTTRSAVVDLRAGIRLAGPAFSHRSGGIGARLADWTLRHGSRTVLRLGGLVRIALHPDDLAYPELRRSTLTAIDRCLDSGITATTYRELLGPSEWSGLAADPTPLRDSLPLLGSVFNARASHGCFPYGHMSFTRDR